MNGGQSSTHATRESMSFAYAARACADLLTCLLTCEMSKVLNSCNLTLVPGAEPEGGERGGGGVVYLTPPKKSIIYMLM